MTLTVRKPDFLKDSMWQFQHGRASVTAPILDELWLEKFQGRAIATVASTELVEFWKSRAVGGAPHMAEPAALLGDHRAPG